MCSTKRSTAGHFPCAPTLFPQHSVPLTYLIKGFTRTRSLENSPTKKVKTTAKLLALTIVDRPRVPDCCVEPTFVQGLSHMPLIPSFGVGGPLHVPPSISVRDYGIHLTLYRSVAWQSAVDSRAVVGEAVRDSLNLNPRQQGHWRLLVVLGLWRLHRQDPEEPGQTLPALDAVAVRQSSPSSFS